MSKYDVKFIVRTTGKRTDNCWWSDNKYYEKRHASFTKGLEGYKIGVLQFQDVLTEIKEGKKAPVFKFSLETDSFVKTEDYGIDARVVASEVFEFKPNSFSIKKANLTACLNYFVKMQQDKKIETIINNPPSIKSQDKIWLLDVQKNLRNVPIAYTMHFTNKKNLKNFLAENQDKNYVLKSRMGMAGSGVFPLNKELINGNFEEYILQENVSPIFCELRLIFGPDQEYLGARSFYQRRAPWEDKQTSKKEHKAIKYIPSQEIIQLSRNVIKYSKVDFGSADWLVKISNETKLPKKINEDNLSDIVNKHGKLFLAEVNGFGTNFGPLVSPYDLNETVAKRLAAKYLK